MTFIYARLLGLLMFAFAASAHAGLYLGVNGGQLSDSKAWFDDETSIKNAVIGFDFTPNFGVELTRTEWEGLKCCDNVVGRGYYQALQAVGTLPLSDNGRFFGKLGVAKWEYRTDAEITPILNVSDEGSNVIYGFGYRYQLWDNIGLNLEYSVLTLKDIAKDIGLDEEQLTMLLLGVRVDF